MDDKKTIDRLIERSALIETKLVKAEIVIDGLISEENRKKAFEDFAGSTKHKNQKEQIFEFLVKFGPATRREIEECLKMRSGSVSGRLKELRTEGLVVEAGSKECFYTSKIVTIYSALTDVSKK